MAAAAAGGGDDGGGIGVGGRVTEEMGMKEKRTARPDGRSGR